MYLAVMLVRPPSDVEGVLAVAVGPVWVGPDPEPLGRVGLP